MKYTACPVDTNTLSHRRTTIERHPQPIHKDEEGVWHINNYSLAKQVLRENDLMRQAGFSAEFIDTNQNPLLKNPPVLFAWGDVHKQQRRAIARFFTPQATKAKHQPRMQEYTDALIAQLKTAGQLELGTLTMKLAADVACDVVGLTNSDVVKRNKRIEQIITEAGGNVLKAENGGILTRVWASIVAQWYTAKFYFFDVRPAISVRKKERQEDVISHLIDEGYSGLEILVECITYATAGMATTREFILLAAWHMLENDALKSQYLAAEESERHQILEEILRVEPIVTRLYRRTVEPFQVGDVTIPAGAKIALHIEEINVDEEMVGEASTAVCPMRAMPSGVLPHVLSFGDGHHRCPGAAVAIIETDVFLRELMRLPNLKLVSEPRVEFDALIESRNVRNFVVSIQ